MIWPADALAKCGNPAVQELVAKYGDLAVWRAGIDVLRFPVTWCINGAEVLQVAMKLAESIGFDS